MPKGSFVAILCKLVKQKPGFGGSTLNHGKINLTQLANNIPRIMHRTISRFGHFGSYPYNRVFHLQGD